MFSFAAMEAGSDKKRESGEKMFFVLIWMVHKSAWMQLCLVRYFLEYLRADDNCRINSFFLSFRIWLDYIEGDVLILLCVPFVIFSVVKGSVCFKDMLDTILKCGDKFLAVPLKNKILSGKAIF